MNCNPARWLEAATHQNPDAAALIGSERALRFTELHARADQMASDLGRRRHRGSVIPMQLRSRWRTALLLHGVIRLGAIPFPIDPALPEKQLAHLLGLTGAAAPLRDEDVVLHPADGRGDDPASILPADGVQLIIATSGTEGRPKGVMLSGANLCAAVEASAQRIPLGPGDRWLDCLPLHHIGGLAILYRCLAAGAAVVLHEGFDAALVWRDLRAHRITHLSLVPAMLARLLDVAAGMPPPSALRHVLIGGATLEPALAARAEGWPLCVSYGMSETGSQLATDCTPNTDRERGWVGHPLPGFEVRVRRETGGRIEVRGPAVMAGYANPRLRPGEGLEEGWFVTQDLGVLEASGALRVTGRADALLVSGGENVDPALVERVLESCPGVEQAGVSAVSDPVWGDRLVAFVVGPVDADELEHWCRERLPSNHRPRTFVAVVGLPRTALGKLQRGSLREWAEEGVPDAYAVSDA